MLVLGCHVYTMQIRAALDDDSYTGADQGFSQGMGFGGLVFKKYSIPHVLNHARARG